MRTTNVPLQPGTNRLPQLYNASVSVRSVAPQAHVRATTTPLVETDPQGHRNPQATMVAFDMEWPDAIRLGVRLLRMAQICRAELPQGVVVPAEALTLVTPEQDERQQPSISEAELTPEELIIELDPQLSNSGKIAAIKFLRGDGQSIEMFFDAESLKSYGEAFLELYAIAAARRGGS